MGRAECYAATGNELGRCTNGKSRDQVRKRGLRVGLNILLGIFNIPRFFHHDCERVSPLCEGDPRQAVGIGQGQRDEDLLVRA